MHKLTKIVATISDRNCSVQFLRSLHHQGMNVVRINTAHTTPESLTTILKNTREASPDIAVMIDTKGPEIRTTATFNGSDIEFFKGQRVRIAGDPAKLTTQQTIYVNYPDISIHVSPGVKILIDDGELEFKVDRVDSGIVYTTCQNEGMLGNRKSVNIPGVNLDLESLTKRDRQNIELACRLGADFVAHSFVRSVADVETVKQCIADNGGHMKVISKIENQQGVDNFDAIAEVSYGIMIARGDLGIEVAAETIPSLQKMMIRKCIDLHRPVIVATQMLHSMIENPRPTRAEVSDVAAAVEQRADALMLSGETAKGKYPVDAVRTMAAIARAVEKTMEPDPLTVPPMTDRKTRSFLARQAVISQARLGTKAIITDTYTGRTARYIASFRAQMPTFAICYSKDTMRSLALSYGVLAFEGSTTSTTGDDDEITRNIHMVLEGSHFHADDLVAYLGGRPGQGNGTTFLEIDSLSRIVKPK